MSDFKSLDWNKMRAFRRQLAGEPDEETLNRLLDLWQERLGADSEFSDSDLDEELVKLLEKIHHAF
jgi:hypothetical protein